MAETQSRATYGAREITVAGVKVEVFPVRFSAARKFAAALSKIIEQLLAAAGKPGGVAETAKGLAPMIADDCIELVDACTVPKLTEVDPSWTDTLVIVGAWIEENVSHLENLRPLAEALERTIEKLTGAKIDLKTLFSSLLPQATAAPTSSTAGETDGHTPDGPSQSSNPISAPPGT